VIPNIGPLEIAIVLVVVLLLFGSRRMPELGRSLGGGIRGFGRALKGEGGPDSVEAGESVRTESTDLLDKDLPRA